MPCFLLVVDRRVSLPTLSAKGNSSSVLRSAPPPNPTTALADIAPSTSAACICPVHQTRLCYPYLPCSPNLSVISRGEAGAVQWIYAAGTYAEVAANVFGDSIVVQADNMSPSWNKTTATASPLRLASCPGLFRVTGQRADVMWPSL